MRTVFKQGQPHQVSRGGSWLNLARYCRAANRYRRVPGFRNLYLGLRLARRLK
jgi:formylglycine-generating enzyme required for sulfatase activity